MGKIREFTEDVYNYLIDNIEKNDEILEKAGDWFGDRWLKIKGWFDKVELDDDMSNVKQYHRDIIELNNWGIEKVNSVFKEVDTVERRNTKKINSSNDTLVAYNNALSKLCESISNPKFSKEFDSASFKDSLQVCANILKIAQWKKLLSKGPDAWTDEDIYVLAYYLLTTEDVDSIERIIETCYSKVTPAESQIGGIKTIVVMYELNEGATNKLYETMELMTWMMVCDNREKAKVDAFCNASQRTQLLHTILRNNNNMSILSQQNITSNKSYNISSENLLNLSQDTEGNLFLDYNSYTGSIPNVSHSYKPIRVTISKAKSGQAAECFAKEESLYYVSSLCGLTDYTTKKGIEKKLIGMGLEHVTDAAIDLVPGSNIINAGIDISGMIQHLAGNTSNISSIQQISNISSMGTVLDMFNLYYISSDTNNNLESHTFSIYPTIGDKGTQTFINNLNTNLAPGGKYNNYAGRIGYSNELTIEQIINNPESVMVMIDNIYKLCSEDSLEMECFIEVDE